MTKRTYDDMAEQVYFDRKTHDHEQDNLMQAVLADMVALLKQNDKEE